VESIICHIISEHLQTCQFQKRWLQKIPTCSCCGEPSHGTTIEDFQLNDEHLRKCRQEQLKTLEYLHSLGYNWCTAHRYSTNDSTLFENHMKMHYLEKLGFTATNGVLTMDDIQTNNSPRIPGTFECSRCNHEVHDDIEAEYHMEQHKYIPVCLGTNIIYHKNSVGCVKCGQYFSGSLVFLKHFKSEHLKCPEHVKSCCTWCGKNMFDQHILDKHYWWCAKNYEQAVEFFKNMERLNIVLIGNMLSITSPLALIDEYLLRTITQFVK
jgi:hypothetical protein